MKKEIKVGAVIAAGGSGSRMGAGVSKLRLALLDKPILAWAIEALARCEAVSEIVISAAEGDISFVENLVGEMGYSKVKKVVRGGQTRQKSVYNGLCELGQMTHALVHDGARALAEPADIEKVINAAANFSAAALGVKVKDTVKVADENLFVDSTPKRERLWNIQTPQVFEKELILRAHRAAQRDGFLGSDDCSLVERLGVRPAIVEGRYDNIKITTPEDLVFAAALRGGLK